MHYVIRKGGEVIAWGDANHDDFSGGIPDGFEWVASPYAVAQPEPTVKSISGVAFLRRFTQAQRIAIRNLGKTDPIVDDILRLLDAAIAQGGDVNLLDQDTVAGVGYLATALPAQNINPAVILA